MVKGREDYDDLPLPGPWNRRQTGKPPSETKTPVPDKQEDVLEKYETGTKDNKKDKEVIIVREIETPAPDTEPVSAVKNPKGAPAETIGADDRKAAGGAGESVRDIPIQGGKSPGKGRLFLESILSPSTLYAGIIMSEVLGGRGGRSRRRRGL